MTMCNVYRQNQDAIPSTKMYGLFRFPRVLISSHSVQTRWRINTVDVNNTVDVTSEQRGKHAPFKT